jgi:hypothetical protein
VLYAAVTIALACVFALDPIFVTNLTRAFGGAIPPLSLGLWETGDIGIFSRPAGGRDLSGEVSNTNAPPRSASG